MKGPYPTYGVWFIVPGEGRFDLHSELGLVNDCDWDIGDMGLGMMMIGMRYSEGRKSGFGDFWLGHGTLGTWQVAPKREEKGDQRQATQ